MSVLDNENQCSEGGRHREQVECNGLHGGKDRSEPAEQSKQRPAHHQRHNGRKAVSDDRFIISVECRDAANEKCCARDAGESWRAGPTQLPHPVDLVAQETELAGNTSSSAARPSLLRNVRRVSRERSVREARLLCARVVIEITRSLRGSLARRLERRSSASHPASLCAMESVGNSTMTRNDSTTPPRSIRSRVCSAWTDSAAWGSQSPRGRLVSKRLTCQASRSKGVPAIKRASQGCATITFPHCRQRFPVLAARCESNFAVKGIRPRSIRGPSNTSATGTRVFVSNTLIPVTRNPATPIERISLIGTVKRARNPMATVAAEIKSVRPA